MTLMAQEYPAPPGRVLTIGEVAELTGVPSATLRSWEERFGFPVPQRSAGGQRRYTEGQVDQVRRVLAERARGLALGPAIALLAEEVEARSVFADLRAAHPHVDVLTVGVRVMNALTYAIEDECLAHATRPLLLGCFQSVGSYERASTRWNELARRARRAVVLSDFDLTDGQAAPERVALPSHSPLLNEWGLVCDDEALSVALVGWERPAQGGRRVFEALVTVESDVVRDAAARYAQAARRSGLPDAEALVVAGAPAALEERRSMSLLRRFATYADA
jgi:DNA-binding transcriptional MerR regulator